MANRVLDHELYPRNSVMEKPAPPAEKKEIIKVTSGTVSEKKKSFLEKAKSAFVEEDGKTIGAYILYDILIPAAKDLLHDIIAGGLDMALYKGNPPRRGGSHNRSQNGVTYINYSSMNNRQQQNRQRVQNSFDSSALVFEIRSDAEAVLGQLCDAIDSYGDASVADFYQSTGRIGEYTDNKYGWKDLRTARILRVQGGYVLDLPPAEYIG